MCASTTHTSVIIKTCVAYFLKVWTQRLKFMVFYTMLLGKRHEFIVSLYIRCWVLPLMAIRVIYIRPYICYFASACDCFPFMCVCV